MTEASHVFDQAIECFNEGDELYSKPHPAYQNMVGPFGGISAAVLLNAVLTHPEVKGAPISITINYLGPISSEAFQVIPRLMRTNRSNQHWSVEAVADGESVLTATVVLAYRTESWKSTELAMPTVTHYAEVDSLPTDMTPPWTKNYDMRFVTGGALFIPIAPDNNDEIPSETISWVRDKPERDLDFPSLCAICDTFFPRLFIRKGDFVPIGTVTFTVYFHVDQQEVEALDSPWVLTHARASKFHGSYFDQTGEIWGENGKLLATTSQLVYYKSPPD